MNTLEQKRKLSRTAKQRIFFWCIIALPLLQFCVFYIGVNLNSILLAFRNYDYETGYSFAGFSNFKRVWYDWINNEIFGVMFANSFLTYAVTLLVGLTLALLFSYFIYKKMPLSNMFRVMLFMPNILSTLVMVLLFKYFSENAIPELLGNSIGGLLSTTKTAMSALLFFLIWTGFGTQVLMFVGAMNNISESVVESAKLDGISPFKEFIFISVPLIWPTVVTFIIVGISVLFTNQLNLYSFYGRGAPFRVQTVGYYLYKSAQSGTLPEYPYLAAMGLMLTFITLPIVLLVKWLLERFGPKVA